jgi:hypothetical protein
MRKKALAREDRYTQIISWFAIRIQNGNESYATPHEIAKGLDLSPSTKFREMLAELVSMGRLDAQPVSKSGRYPGKVYMLVEGTFSRPRRLINLKFRGRQSGQLELF